MFQHYLIPTDFLLNFVGEPAKILLEAFVLGRKSNGDERICRGIYAYFLDTKMAGSSLYIIFGKL